MSVRNTTTLPVVEVIRFSQSPTSHNKYQHEYKSVSRYIPNSRLILAARFHFVSFSSTLTANATTNYSYQTVLACRPILIDSAVVSSRCTWCHKVSFQTCF